MYLCFSEMLRGALNPSSSHFQLGSGILSRMGRNQLIFSGVAIARLHPPRSGFAIQCIEGEMRSYNSLKRVHTRACKVKRFSPCILLRDFLLFTEIWRQWRARKSGRNLRKSTNCGILSYLHVFLFSMSDINLL